MKYNQNSAHADIGNQKLGRLATLHPSKPFFDALLKEYNQKKWIVSDPAQFMHRYTEPQDQELAAFISACFAYGSAQLVIRAVNRILEPMQKGPSRFIQAFDSRRDAPLLKGFYHRFHKQEHLIALLEILNGILRKYGTLGGFFKQLNTVNTEALLNFSMRYFQDEAMKWTQANIAPEKQRAFYRGMRFFFNAPEDGSACKRMSMFLKWMVRKDDIDLGLWDWFEASKLIIPVDTHIARLSYYLRLRKGKIDRTPNWKMALEVTNALKQLNPSDPVCYDFAITRLGILGLCKRKFVKVICNQCPVQPVCRFGARANQ